jgi:hypothetical protein
MAGNKPVPVLGRQRMDVAKIREIDPAATIAAPIIYQSFSNA